MKNFKHWPLVAFVILALFGGIALAQQANTAANQLYQSQLEACDRGNILRASVNINVKVLDSFLTRAAEQRTIEAQAAKGDERDSLIATADRYGQLAEATTPVPMVNCKEAIKKP